MDLERVTRHDVDEQRAARRTSVAPEQMTSTDAATLEVAAGPVGLMIRLPLDSTTPEIERLVAAGLIDGRVVEVDERRGPIVLFTATEQGRAAAALLMARDAEARSVG